MQFYIIFKTRFIFAEQTLIIRISYDINLFFLLYVIFELVLLHFFIKSLTTYMTKKIYYYHYNIYLTSFKNYKIL